MYVWMFVISMMRDWGYTEGLRKAARKARANSPFGPSCRVTNEALLTKEIC